MGARFRLDAGPNWLPRVSGASGFGAPRLLLSSLAARSNEGVSRFRSGLAQLRFQPSNRSRWAEKREGADLKLSWLMIAPPVMVDSRWKLGDWYPPGDAYEYQEGGCFMAKTSACILYWGVIVCAQAAPRCSQFWCICWSLVPYITLSITGVPKLIWPTTPL